MTLIQDDIRKSVLEVFNETRRSQLHYILRVPNSRSFNLLAFLDRISVYNILADPLHSFLYIEYTIISIYLVINYDKCKQSFVLNSCSASKDYKDLQLNLYRSKVKKNLG